MDIILPLAKALAIAIEFLATSLIHILRDLGLKLFSLVFIEKQFMMHTYVSQGLDLDLGVKRGQKCGNEPLPVRREIGMGFSRMSGEATNTGKKISP